ncbi:hypothetical protein [uncultured Shewanella sp.]|uniref:hypothetical protein n=1 Tax=uncultured Shewanella sp. TaxID=173975 RepID=UPI00261563E7|nr:hypothetical protein [uncultured Shewanella sp.]
MDIFEEALSKLGVKIQFDSENVFACELTEKSQGNHSSELFFSAYRDQSNMSLRLAVMTQHSITQEMEIALYQSLLHAAAGPLRGDIGVAILEGSNRITVYQTVLLSENNPTQVMEMIEKLIAEAEKWDKELISR